MGELTGKQLGIKVAKRVMGWIEYDGNSTDLESPVFADVIYEGLTLYENGIGSDLTRQWAPWRDMNDAWGVHNEHWLWRIREHQMGVNAVVTVTYPQAVHHATVLWDEGLSRREAWCTVRLRAALVAVEQKETVMSEKGGCSCGDAV